MLQTTKKTIFICLGFLFVALGILGILLPLLPTTPFILLAAYFFSKSSERLHRWLTTQRQFGPLIQDWEQHGVIRKKPKIIATIMIVSVFAISTMHPQVPAFMRLTPATEQRPK